MAITISLVESGRNRLRYLCSTTSTGIDTDIITTHGAATPDVMTDLVSTQNIGNQGVMMALCKTPTDGYGKLAPGDLDSQAEARALWLSDDASNAIGANANGAIPSTVIMRFAASRGTTALAGWSVDVDYNSEADAVEINVQSIGGGQAYLDIEIPGVKGV